MEASLCVVKFLFFTSNHNGEEQNENLLAVVKFLFFTSNHNCHPPFEVSCRVVKFLFFTSNHNRTSEPTIKGVLSSSFFLHQTTT